MGGGPESRCIGRVYGLDGACIIHTAHYLSSGSKDHHQSTKSVQKIICCNLTSNAPDDGRMRPKHVELRIHQQITLLHQVGISHYFMVNMHGETTLKFLSLLHIASYKYSDSKKSFNFCSYGSNKNLRAKFYVHESLDDCMFSCSKYPECQLIWFCWHKYVQNKLFLFNVGLFHYILSTYSLYIFSSVLVCCIPCHQDFIIIIFNKYHKFISFLLRCILNFLPLCFV